MGARLTSATDLSTPEVRRSRYVRAVCPICLPDKNDRPRTDCTVTGWGRLGDFGRRPDYLMQVNTPFKDEHV